MTCLKCLGENSLIENTKILKGISIESLMIVFFQLSFLFCVERSVLSSADNSTILVLLYVLLVDFEIVSETCTMELTVHSLVGKVQASDDAALCYFSTVPYDTLEYCITV